MTRLPILLCLLALPLVLAAGTVPEKTAEKAAAGAPQKEKTWWEKRHDRADIFYPHKAHQAVMKKGGDACLLCHPFGNNTLKDIKQLQTLNVIANEPLEAICHSCHVTDLTAPWRCDICHTEPAAIWPASHDFNYVDHHAEDARLDDGGCRQCHIDLSFCTDCHFRRDASQRRVHTLGYRSSHGLDARSDPADCGRCHNATYCSDCHRGRR